MILLKYLKKLVICAVALFALAMSGFIILKHNLSYVSYDDVLSSSYNTSQKNNTQNRIVILAYHSVTDHVKSKKEIYQVSQREFEMQIKTLKKYGFEFIDDNMLYDFYYNNGKLPKKSVMITFDDGMKDVYKYAYPIIQKYNIKASVYLIGSYTDKKEKFLTSDMIRKMKQSNLISFQIHSYNMHKFVYDEKLKKKRPAYLTRLKKETKQQYIKRIDKDIKNAIHSLNNLGIYPISMTYPFGGVNDELVSVIKNNGLKLGFVGFDNSLDDINTDVYHLQRYNINENTNTPKKLLKLIRYNTKNKTLRFDAIVKKDKSKIIN